MRTWIRAINAVAAAMAAAALLAACGTTDEEATDTAAEDARTSAQPAEEQQPLSPGEERGRALFVETCGACHTLDAAGTQGAIGPDLDEAPTNEAEVLDAIARGGKGSGNMPAGLLSGKDAQDVAAFVAASGP